MNALIDRVCDWVDKPKSMVKQESRFIILWGIFMVACGALILGVAYILTDIMTTGRWIGVGIAILIPYLIWVLKGD